MKKFLVLAVFALFTPVVSVFAAGVGGTYAVEGTNPDGSGYAGTCVISGDEASGYTFNWTVGSSQYSGTGTMSGKKLTVDWGQPDPVIYKVSPDGSQLKGKWGPGGKGKETLTRQ